MARHVARWELAGVGGPVVVVDVIRAFTTAAYAFGSGAAEIFLVGDVEQALAFKDVHPGTIALGENRGLRPDGFDCPDSPAVVSRVDLASRTLVQRADVRDHGQVRGPSGRERRRHRARCWPPTTRRGPSHSVRSTAIRPTLLSPRPSTRSTSPWRSNAPISVSG